MKEFLLNSRESVRGYWGSFLEELAENQRLVWMIWGIGYLLVLYLIVGLYEYNQVLGDTYSRLEREAARMSGVQDEALWRERLDAEKELRDVLLGSCWSARSERLASADVQTRLQDITSENQLENSRLNMARAEVHELDPGVFWLIRANISGRIERGRVVPLVEALEAGDKHFVIEQLRYVHSKTGGSLDMTVAVCSREQAS